MSYRAAINGYGRIGRCVLRALYESGYRDHIKITAINEPSNIETIAHLTQYDSTHGKFPGSVKFMDNNLVINDDFIRVTFEKDISKLPWADLDIDVVLECTGGFSSRKIAENHIESGAEKVVFSQPADPDVDATIVYGINDDLLCSKDTIISNASCTTNCIVPVLKILDEAFGIESGMITTIHSMMNDQPVIDAYHHQDLRRTRSSGQSIIPVDTELARGICRILPEMEGKFEAIALRVPVINVSVMDLTVIVRTDTDVKTVNNTIKSAIQNESLKGILGYTEEPLASCDFNHDPRSSVVDGNQTRVSGRRVIKILTWFDNEWAYANRMLDTALSLMNAAKTEMAYSEELMKNRVSSR